MACIRIIHAGQIVGSTDMANSNNWGEIYKSTWWGDKAWSANTLFIDSAPPGFGLNLLKASEDMDNTLDWLQKTGATVSAQNTNDPNGELTAERVDFIADQYSRIQQLVTLEASTTYTFSVHAKVPSSSQDFRLRVFGVSGATGSFTALSSDWTRFDFDFTTTTAGTYTLAIMNDADGASRSIQFWGAMLNEGADVGEYVKTDASVGGSSPSAEYEGFGDAFGGAAAYYSLRRYTEAEETNAIRVRRSSDDTEQDIGFDANGDLDTTALTTFVNEDVDTYTSDFSSGTDSFTEHSTTNAGNIDGVSDGTTSKDDVLRVTMTGGSISHQIRRANIFDGANTYDISFEYYIPSANTKLDQIVFRTNVGGDGDTAFSNVGTWSTGSISDFTPSGTQVRFNATDGGSFIFDADGDVFYLKNIVVTQTTADGAVTTWYDQTGNGNDATNSTESEQPLVVSGGTLVTENSKAAIDFDGVNDAFAISVGITSGFAVFGVYKNTKDGSYLLGSPNAQFGRRGTSEYRFHVAGSFSTNGGAHSNNQVLFTGIEDSANATIYANGIQQAQAASVFSSDTLTLISRVNVLGNIQEIIIFNSDQSANRGTVTTGGGTGIEGNINTYFDIV